MWQGILKALQRIALSENDKINTDFKSPSDQPRGGKPEGLWYSFSLGQGWMRGQIYNYGWLDEYKYILYLDTSSLNILQIKNAEEAMNFIYKYVPLNGKTDWPRIATKYDGIEILNYREWGRHNREVREQFYGWDMDSGCIWNTQNLKLKKVKPIEQRHYNKSENRYQRRMA